MTITLDTTKADLIIAIGRALMEQKRVDEAITFYQLAAHARDVQEVLLILPDDLEVEYAAA